MLGLVFLVHVLLPVAIRDKPLPAPTGAEFRGGLLFHGPYVNALVGIVKMSKSLTPVLEPAHSNPCATRQPYRLTLQRPEVVLQDGGPDLQGNDAGLNRPQVVQRRAERLFGLNSEIPLGRSPAPYQAEQKERPVDQHVRLVAIDNPLKFFDLPDHDHEAYKLRLSKSRWFLVRADKAPAGPEVCEAWDLNAGDGSYLSYARSKDGEVSLRFAAPGPLTGETLMISDLKFTGRDGLPHDFGETR